MNNSVEQELIKQCINKERKGQKLLFEKYNKAMFNVAYRICNDHDLSSDILLEGFMDVFTDLKNFRQESSLGSWIKTIMVRTALRKIKSKLQFVALDTSEHDQPIEWTDGFEAEDLDKAIKSLPDGYRTVFLLIEKEGFKHKEVAEMLNVSEGTSKSQLYNAKKLLQQKLTRY